MSSHQPVAAQDRISSIDILRGVALLGILLMNIIGFGLPLASYFDPSVDGATEGRNLLAYIVNWLFFEGSMRGIFSMLFGASVVLLTVKADEMNGSIKVADIYFRRTLLLIGFGVINAYLFLWFGDILYTYGVVGLILFAFRKLSARTLIICSLIVFTFMYAKTWVANQHLHDLYAGMDQVAAYEEAGRDLTPELEAIKAEYVEKAALYAPSPEQAAGEVAIRQGSYWDNVSLLAGINRYIQTEVFYDTYLWDALAAMLLGMAFFKLGIFSAGRSVGFYLGMVVIGYGIGLPVNWYEIQNALATGFAWEWTQFDYMLTYELGRMGAAMGHIGIVMLLCKWNVLGLLGRSLAAVGQMALTNYLGHSVMAMFIFTGVGFGLVGQLERYELYYVVLGMWLVNLVLSPIWLHYFRFGPVEWVWRSLTYGQKQPMKR